MMFRLYRKTVFPRWCVNHKQSSENKNQGLKHPKKVIIFTSSQEESHSNKNHKKKQHAFKEDKKCWDDPQFHFNFIQSSLLETAGWGTAVLYASYHLKQIHNIFEYDRVHSTCIFSNKVLAMPKYLAEDKKSPTHVPHLVSPSSDEQTPENNKVSSNLDVLDSFKNLTHHYISAAQNAAGLKNINKNDKKAFRSFQTAARLGSIQGFYNLGLCYELGKGTRVNLNMAAFCYRKAAMKGHGLASFNLAIFFYKGMGGLPVDAKIAKELLAEAAEKNVPEAQLYFGVEFLEEKRYEEAVTIFSSLVEKNIPEAQYYLGLCYENGLGVMKNDKLAFELLKKSATQGNKKAMQKLQNHEENPTSDIQQSQNLHVSASVPELGALVKKPTHSTTKFTISSYLDLITPFLLVKSDANSKENFSDSENIGKDCSKSILPFRRIPLAMKIKT